MEIEIRRFAYKSEYTIGKLYVKREGRGMTYYCDTLEPRSAHVSRKDNSVTIKALKKEYGKIAIPTGSYKVKMGMSRKFYRMMPYLLNVKGFEGIMIHPGNYPKDTLGCILPGWNRRTGMVCASCTAFNELLGFILYALSGGETVTVTIVER